MKILVVAATATEMNSIKKGIKSAGIKTKLDIDYLCSGIGNYETIFSLENYLTSHPEPVFVLNIGVCGYWNINNERKNNPIQVASILNIHSEKEIIVPPYLTIAPLKNCFSSEIIVFNKPIFNRDFGSEDELYFDMESRGVGFVASKHKLPYLILKVPFDLIGEDTKGLFNDKLKFISNERIRLLLHDLPYHDYIMKVLERIQKNNGE